jgi:hypothetical protein
MFLLALIFPASVLFAVGSGFFCGLRYGRRSFEFRLCLLALAYLFFSYVSGFVAVCFHPYWIDNEVGEFIPWSERWSWAFLGATAFEVVLCPLLLLGYSILRSRHNRNLRSNRVPNTTQVA